MKETKDDITMEPTRRMNKHMDWLMTAYTVDQLQSIIDIVIYPNTNSTQMPQESLLFLSDVIAAKNELKSN